MGLAEQRPTENLKFEWNFGRIDLESKWSVAVFQINSLPLSCIAHLTYNSWCHLNMSLKRSPCIRLRYASSMILQTIIQPTSNPHHFLGKQTTSSIFWSVFSASPVVLTAIPWVQLPVLANLLPPQHAKRSKHSWCLEGGVVTVWSVWSLFERLRCSKRWTGNTVFLLSFVGESSTLGDEYTISNRSWNNISFYQRTGARTCTSIVNFCSVIRWRKATSKYIRSE